MQGDEGRDDVRALTDFKHMRLDPLQHRRAAVAAAPPSWAQWAAWRGERQGQIYYGSRKGRVEEEGKVAKWKKKYIMNRPWRRREVVFDVIFLSKSNKNAVEMDLGGGGKTDTSFVWSCNRTESSRNLCSVACNSFSPSALEPLEWIIKATRTQNLHCSLRLDC